ncbi:MAG TPA: hypothetical protein VHY31_13575 [Streptosporangiaceae bacterium]|nr:hypothetical protein [Streptosporangiaceae bacterium]
MTETPRARDGSPSIAALAVHINALHRDLRSLTAKVDTLTGAQQEHAAVFGDMTELRRQVEQLLAILNEDDDTSPAAWFWLTMTDEQRDEHLAELLDWVETVLRLQYPGYLVGQIRPCWLNHIEARWELAWLYQLWSLAYLARRPEPRAAADWHDRWFPGVTRRLGQIMAKCEGACERQPGLSRADDVQSAALL